MKRKLSFVLALVLALGMLSNVTVFATTPLTDASSDAGNAFKAYVGDSDFDTSKFFLAPIESEYLVSHPYATTKIDITTTSDDSLDIVVGYYSVYASEKSFNQISALKESGSGYNKIKETSVSSSSPLSLTSLGTDTVTMSGTGYIGVALKKSTSLSSDVSVTVKVTALNPTNESDPSQIDAANVTYTFLAPKSDPVITKDFPFKKNFVWAEGFDNAGKPIADIENRVSTDATFVIAPYTSYNREVGKTDIPAFAQSSYTIPVSSGTKEITITTPNYYSAGIGDYWYTVTEQPIDKVAGVAIDSVPNATRYLHVQVVWDPTAEGGMKVASVALHSAAPNADGTYNNTEKGTDGSDKTDGFTNTYGAGELKVKKEVSGNMADSNKLFNVTVKFIHPDGKDVLSNINYSGAVSGVVEYGDGWGTWSTGSKLVNLSLKNGDTVTFTNIPAGVTYEVIEDDYTGEGYEVAYAGTNIEGGDTVGTAKFTGTITDSLDEVTITNTKNVAIDVGVILDNAPFILLLVGSMAFFAVYFVTKRRKEEETY